MRVTGHRGAAEVAPENTLQAFRTAIESRVDAIEFDVRATADDELIVMHDETVDRTTDGTGKVSGLTRRELKEFDAGNGEEIPTLDEALAALEDEDVRLRIELKEGGIGERVVDAVTDRSLEHRTTLSSFDSDALKPVVEDPIRIGFIGFEVSEETLEAVDGLDADAMFVNVDTVDKADVKTAAFRDVELGVWTVNSPEGVDRAVAIGADSITTDRPEMVVRRLRD